MKIGDIVFYPMHGAGVIDGIENTEVAGIEKSYYILKLPIGNLKLMLPIDRIDQLGLRGVIDKSKLEEVETVLRSRPEHAHGSWNKRFQAILDRMKSGDVLDVAAVARNLSMQYRSRKISSGEKRLMDLSRQILISELVYACEKSPEEVTGWIDNIMCKDK
ncbi:MAG: CarD family transcriptional regulator [Selenomonadaceae bacterium]|nr:CarD family transcriptional regulator [Selenomonadaceae bacterium]